MVVPVLRLGLQIFIIVGNYIGHHSAHCFLNLIFQWRYECVLFFGIERSATGLLAQFNWIAVLADRAMSGTPLHQVGISCYVFYLSNLLLVFWYFFISLRATIASHFYFRQL